MAEKKLLMNGMTVTSAPVFVSKEDGDYCYFTVMDSRDKLKIVCFDDERKNAPFKVIKNLTDKGSFKIGTIINAECIYSLYDTCLISEEAWKNFSDKPNPTRYKAPSYKLIYFEFTIPREIYDKLKEKESKKKVKKIDDLSEFEN